VPDKGYEQFAVLRVAVPGDALQERRALVREVTYEGGSS